MSVYTRVSQQQLEAFLLLYTLGDLLSFVGIKAGIENTNYAVTTTRGEYILTLYESFSEDQLAEFFLLLNDLTQNDFPAPKPQPSLSGQFSNCLNAKPAAFFNRLPGYSIDSPCMEQCEQVGYYLARLHSYTLHTNFQHANLKDLTGCQSLFNQIKLLLTVDDFNLLSSELSYQTSQTLPHLPRGIIHADLFKDNVLFEEGCVSGILDFYNACTGYYLYDIAVTGNDWCSDNGSLNHKKFSSLMAGYQKIRLLNQDELHYLPVFLRLAALRFCLSRLEHQFNPRAGDLTLEKDPMIFRQLLKYHRNSNWTLCNDRSLPTD